MARTGVQVGVQADKIRLGQQIRQWSVFTLGCAGMGRIIDVIPDGLQPQRLHAPRHLLANAPKANYPKCFALNLQAQRWGGFSTGPTTAAHIGFIRKKAQRQVEDKAHREIGDSVGQHAGRVADDDAMFGCFGDVKGIIADAGGREHAQFGRSIKKFCIAAYAWRQQHPFNVVHRGQQIRA